MAPGGPEGRRGDARRLTRGDSTRPRETPLRRLNGRAVGTGTARSAGCPSSSVGRDHPVSRAGGTVSRPPSGHAAGHARPATVAAGTVRTAERVDRGNRCPGGRTPGHTAPPPRRSDNACARTHHTHAGKSRAGCSPHGKSGNGGRAGGSAAFCRPYAELRATDSWAPAGSPEWTIQKRTEAPMSESGTLRTIRTDIPARLDRLPWSRFHWRIVIGLGAVWISTAWR